MALALHLARGSLQCPGGAQTCPWQRPGWSLSSPWALRLRGLVRRLLPLPGAAVVRLRTCVGALLRSAMRLSVLSDSPLEAPCKMLRRMLVLCCAVGPTTSWLIPARHNMPCVSHPHTDTHGSLLLPRRLPGYLAMN